MPLDFKRAAELFMGTEGELAQALGVSVPEVRAALASSRNVPPALLVRLGRVLQERGAGMKRVGELLESGGRG